MTEWSDFYQSSYQVLGDNQTYSYTQNVLIREIYFYKTGSSIVIRNNVLSLIALTSFVDCDSGSADSPLTLACKKAVLVGCRIERCSRAGAGSFLYADFGDNDAASIHSVSAVSCGTFEESKWGVFYLNRGYYDASCNNISYSEGFDISTLCVEATEMSFHSFEIYANNKARDCCTVDFEDGVSTITNSIIVGNDSGLGKRNRGFIKVENNHCAFYSCIITDNEGQNLFHSGARTHFNDCYIQKTYNGEELTLQNVTNPVIYQDSDTSFKICLKKKASVMPRFPNKFISSILTFTIPIVPLCFINN